MPFKHGQSNSRSSQQIEVNVDVKRLFRVYSGFMCIIFLVCVCVCVLNANPYNFYFIARGINFEQLAYLVRDLPKSPRTTLDPGT